MLVMSVEFYAHLGRVLFQMTPVNPILLIFFSLFILCIFLFLVSIQFIQIEQYKYIKGISSFSKKDSWEENWAVESNFVILALVDLLYFVPEIEITQIAAPDPCPHIHRVLAFFKVVEKKHIQCQNTSDGNEVPHQILLDHKLAVLPELPWLPWQPPCFVQEVAKIKTSNQQSKH